VAGLLVKRVAAGLLIARRLARVLRLVVLRRLPVVLLLAML